MGAGEAAAEAGKVRFLPVRVAGSERKRDVSARRDYSPRGARQSADSYVGVFVVNACRADHERRQPVACHLQNGIEGIV